VPLLDLKRVLIAADLWRHYVVPFAPAFAASYHQIALRM
jgi:hypothetical protein